MTNQIVATIAKGHRIVTDTATYEVLGNMKLRGKYFYKVRDTKNNRVASISREEVLEAQRDGSAKITA